MSGWDKLSAISVACAAVVIPIAIAFIGNGYSQALKERELQGKFVEIALDILRHDPTDKNQSESVRLWATQVIDNYSGIPFPKAAREDLINRIPISSKLYGLSRSGNIEKINDFGAKINTAIKENKNVVIYIHGRTSDPEKLDNTIKDIADDLEEGYGINLISFKWQSHPTGAFDMPYKDAIDSVEELKGILNNLQAYKREHPEVKNTRYTLLIHSYGVTLFKELMDSYSAQTFDKSLFNNIVINSAAVDSKNHSNWINKIDFSDRIYITINNQDAVLSAYGKSKFFSPLGRQVFPPLATKAIYIDVSELGVKHRYFLPKGQEDNLHLCQFYKSVLNGNEPDLINGNYVSRTERIEGNKIYWIKPENDSSGQCIKLNTGKDAG